MFKFFKRQKRQLRFKDPFFLQWHITDKCNLSCSHCYREELKEDLSLDELKHILNQYKDFLEYIGKNGRIQFAGGEPLLSKHLFYIIPEARQAKIPSRILSNGTVISENILEKLLKHNIRLIQISIEGSQEIHDSIRGEGSFARAIEGADLLKANGIEVTFSTTVSKLNIGELEYIAELASDHANRLGYHRLVPFGKGKELEEHLLKPEEVRQFYELINKTIKPKFENIEIVYRDPLWMSYFNPCAKCNFISGCSAGYNGICIESNGDVYPCRRMPIVIGNVLNESLIDIWESKFMKTLRNRDKLKGKCSECNLRWLCGGCRAIAYAVTGDYLAEDPQCFKDI